MLFEGAEDKKGELKAVLEEGRELARSAEFDPEIETWDQLLSLTDWNRAAAGFERKGLTVLRGSDESPNALVIRTAKGDCIDIGDDNSHSASVGLMLRHYLSGQNHIHPAWG